MSIVSFHIARTQLAEIYSRYRVSYLFDIIDFKKLLYCYTALLGYFTLRTQLSIAHDPL